MDALLALAEIRSAAGEPKASVTAALTEVVSMYPTNAAPAQALVRHLLRNGDVPQALLAAQRAAESMPNDLDVTELLGRTQLAAGESAQALSTFRRLVTARPRSPEPHLEMADVYLQRKEIDSAIESVRRAVLLQPQSLSAQTQLAGLLTGNKQWREAIQVARDVQRLHPSHPRGWHLEGLVYSAQKQWGPAVAAFQRAMTLGESAELAMQTYDALRGAGRNTEADALAATWVAKHPKDQSFIGHLADLALVQGDHATAARHYRTILKADEGNVGALNNLAWALLQLGDPDALTQARKAAALQPDSAAVLDTLSLALASADQIDAAIANQRKALALAPDSPALRLHLAQFAVKRGDHALARAELDKLSALGAAFSGQGEVWQLRQQLR
jgi:putative PEP-CTERM system TPR-repeat lipoprotein